MYFNLELLFKSIKKHDMNIEQCCIFAKKQLRPCSSMDRTKVS